MDDSETQGLHDLAAEIVASFVGNHTVAIGDLPALITSVLGALRSLGQPEPEQPEAAPMPAVPIKKSVGTDYLICLEDGRKAKMLKRYLALRYNLTPEQYRQRWGLPKTYPMVAGLCGAALAAGHAARAGPEASSRSTPCSRECPASSRATASGRRAQEEGLVMPPCSRPSGCGMAPVPATRTTCPSGCVQSARVRSRRCSLRPDEAPNRGGQPSGRQALVPSVTFVDGRREAI